MLTGRHFAMLVFVALGCHEVCAESSVPLPMTESQKLGAVFLDNLSIPSPGEVFAAMNSKSHPNWVTLISPATAPVTSDRMQLALVVGVLAANGYIEVEARDGQQVKNTGREMISVAKALSVSEHLMGRGNSLMEFAENEAWDSLADELEATENEVKNTMVERNDRDLVTLTSAAAWLRGLDAATAIVLETPNLDGISVITQPELARNLAAQLDTLPARMKKSALVSKLKLTLEEVAVLLETMGSTPETQRPNIQRIHTASAALVKEILASTGAKTTPAGRATPNPARTGASNIASPKP